MTPHTDPRNADRPISLRNSTKAPPSHHLPTGRTVPNRCARPACRCGSRSSNKHPIHGAENIIQSELLMKSPPSVRQILTVGLSLMRLFARPCGEPGIRRSFRMRIGLPYSDRTLESAKVRVRDMLRMFRTINGQVGANPKTGERLLVMSLGAHRRGARQRVHGNRHRPGRPARPLDDEGTLARRRRGRSAR